MEGNSGFVKCLPFLPLVRKSLKYPLRKPLRFGRGKVPEIPLDSHAKKRYDVSVCKSGWA
jgi:hypothetical protein